MNKKYVVIEIRRDMKELATARRYFDSYDDAFLYKRQLEDKERFGIIKSVFPYFKTEEEEEVKLKKYEKLIYFALSLGAVIGFVSIMAFTWACIRILWKLV